MKADRRTRVTGIGGLRQRGDKSWEIRFDIGTDPATGKRRQRAVSFKANGVQAAKAKAQEIIGNKGHQIDPSKETVAQFIERWLQDWAKGNTSNKTFERYGSLLRRHVAPRIGNLPVQKLRAVDLQGVYAGLTIDGKGEGGLNRRTILHVHRAVHRMLRHAAQWGVVTQNVASLVDAPTVEHTEIEILTPAQVQQVLRTMKQKAMYPLVVTALGTGMRRGELLALRWQDVDLDRAILRVERSLEQTKVGGLVFKAPKTRYGRRSITLPSATVAELRAHWRTQQEHRLALGLGKAPEDSLVFPDWDGSPRSPNAVTKAWGKAIAAEGLTATLHSLRHTHASTLIASGLDVLTISRRLGHGSPAITLSVYGHLFKTDDRAASIMDQAMAGTD